MIRCGEVLHNPVTGELIQFLKTSADTNGEYVEIEVVVEPGTPHKFWNDGAEDARFRCRISPALTFESLIETMFGLANDGKTNAKGMPNPLRLAVIAKAHFDTVRLPFPPAWLQRSGLAVGAPLGRLVGYRPAYEPSAAGESLAV